MNRGRWIEIRDLAPIFGKSTEAMRKWLRRHHAVVRYQGRWVTRADLLRDVLGQDVADEVLFEDDGSPRWGQDPTRRTKGPKRTLKGPNRTRKDRT